MFGVSERRYRLALLQLQAEFPDVPERIRKTVLDGYLERQRSVSGALGAARSRIADACEVE